MTESSAAGRPLLSRGVAALFGAVPTPVTRARRKPPPGGAGGAGAPRPRPPRGGAAAPAGGGGGFLGGGPPRRPGAPPHPAPRGGAPSRVGRRFGAAADPRAVGVASDVPAGSAGAATARR